MMERLSVEERFSNIEYNLKVINDRISEAALKSGRKPEDIKFMAVTKTVEPIFINHAIDCGVKLIGENKVPQAVTDRLFVLREQVKEFSKYVNSSTAKPIDLFGGVHIRRKDMAEFLEYNTEIMQKSIDQSKRIPDGRKELSNGDWW